MELPSLGVLRQHASGALSRLVALQRAYMHVWNAANARFEIQEHHPGVHSDVNHSLVAFRSLQEKLQRIFAIMRPAREIVENNCKKKKAPKPGNANSHSGAAAAAAAPADPAAAAAAAADAASPAHPMLFLRQSLAAPAAAAASAAAPFVGAAASRERARLEARVRMCNLYKAALDRSRLSMAGASPAAAGSSAAAAAASPFPPSSAKFMSIAGLLQAWKVEYEKHHEGTLCRVLIITATAECQTALLHYLRDRCRFRASVPVAPASDLMAELQSFQFESPRPFEALVARVEEVGNGIDMPGVHMVILAQAFEEERKANQAALRARRKGIKHRPQLIRVQTCGSIEEKMSYGTLAPDVADKRMQANAAKVLRFPIQQAEPIDASSSVVDRKKSKGSKQGTKRGVDARGQLLLEQRKLLHLPAVQDSTNRVLFLQLLSFLLQSQVPSSVLTSRACRLRALQLCFGEEASPTQATWLHHVLAQTDADLRVADSAAASIATHGLVARGTPTTLTKALTQSLGLGEFAPGTGTMQGTVGPGAVPTSAAAAAASSSFASSAAAAAAPSSGSSGSDLVSSVADLLRGPFASFMPYVLQSGTKSELGFGSLPLLAQVMQRSICVHADTATEPVDFHPMEADALTHALSRSPIHLRYTGDAEFQLLSEANTQPAMSLPAVSAVPVSASSAAAAAAASSCSSLRLPARDAGPAAMDLDS